MLTLCTQQVAVIPEEDAASRWIHIRLSRPHIQLSRHVVVQAGLVRCGMTGKIAPYVDNAHGFVALLEHHSSIPLAEAACASALCLATSCIALCSRAAGSTTSYVCFSEDADKESLSEVRP
jgi:hypothetical protein